MGGGSWSHDAFRSVSTARASLHDRDVFTSTVIDAAMDPTKMVVRESRDGDDHPESNAIVVAFDVTGSMGVIPSFFAKEALGTLMADLLKKRPVPDPQLLVAAVGDSTCDRFPLQVGQFESDNRADDWLTKIVLEGGGGGQNSESYGLVHHFAGRHTSIDCFEKRQTKGFLFTVGDEHPWAVMRGAEIRQVFGTEAADVRLEDAIAAAQRMYDVFHIVVASGQYPVDRNLPTWRRYLNEKVLVLEDYRALAELVIATIGVCRGMTADAATAGFSAKTTDMVLRAGVSGLPASVAAGAVVRL